MAETEKGQFEVGTVPQYEQREAVDMTHLHEKGHDRKESIVLNEAADLYGDIQTAESEYLLNAVYLRMNTDRSCRIRLCGSWSQISSHPVHCSWWNNRHWSLLGYR